MEKLDKTPEQPQPVQISSLEDLLFHAGSVVKYTEDGGKTWRYARLWDVRELEPFINNQQGVPTDMEVNPERVHVRDSITDSHFQKPDFAVFTTTLDEVAGKQFSYDNLRQSRPRR